MIDHALRPFRPDDVPAVHGLSARHTAADHVDVETDRCWFSPGCLPIRPGVTIVFGV